MGSISDVMIMARFMCEIRVSSLKDCKATAYYLQLFDDLLKTFNFKHYDHNYIARVCEEIGLLQMVSQMSF